MSPVRPSVCLSVRLTLMISVTAVPIGNFSLWNIPTGPMVVSSYFLEKCKKKLKFYSESLGKSPWGLGKSR